MAVGCKVQYYNGKLLIVFLLAAAMAVLDLYGWAEYSPSGPNGPRLLRAHGWPFKYIVSDTITAGVKHVKN
jgi:hypothetical protein